MYYINYKLLTQHINMLNRIIIDMLVVRRWSTSRTDLSETLFGELSDQFGLPGGHLLGNFDEDADILVAAAFALEMRNPETLHADLGIALGARRDFHPFRSPPERGNIDRGT